MLSKYQCSYEIIWIKFFMIMIWRDAIWKESAEIHTSVGYIYVLLYIIHISSIQTPKLINCCEKVG